MIAYLCGPINGRSDADCKDWRKLATDLLTEKGVEILDPMRRDFRGREDDAVTEIVCGDKDDIDASDVLLVYFDKPSVGTSMEVLYAWEHNKVVIIIDASGKPLSPWLKFHSTHIVQSVVAGVELI